MPRKSCGLRDPQEALAHEREAEGVGEDAGSNCGRGFRDRDLQRCSLLGSEHLPLQPFRSRSSAPHKPLRSPSARRVAIPENRRAFKKSTLHLQFIDGQLPWFAALEKAQLFAKLIHPISGFAPLWCLAAGPFGGQFRCG